VYDDGKKNHDNSVSIIKLHSPIFIDIKISLSLSLSLSYIEGSKRVD
jgi:hypothetical protein